MQERIEPRWKSPQALENSCLAQGSCAWSPLPRSPTGVVIGLLLPLAGYRSSAPKEFSPFIGLDCLWPLLVSASMTLVPNFPDSFAQPLINIGNVHVTEKQIITPAGSWPLGFRRKRSATQNAQSTYSRLA